MTVCWLVCLCSLLVFCGFYVIVTAILEISLRGSIKIQTFTKTSLSKTQSRKKMFSTTVTADLWKMTEPQHTKHRRSLPICGEQSVSKPFLMQEGKQEHVWPTLASRGKVLFLSLVFTRLAGSCRVAVKQASLGCRFRPFPVKLSPPAGFLE